MFYQKKKKSLEIQPPLYEGEGNVFLNKPNLHKLCIFLAQQLVGSYVSQGCVCKISVVSQLKFILFNNIKKLLAQS